MPPSAFIYIAPGAVVQVEERKKEEEEIELGNNLLVQTILIVTVYTSIYSYFYNWRSYI